MRQTATSTRDEQASRVTFVLAPCCYSPARSLRLSR